MLKRQFIRFAASTMLLSTISLLPLASRAAESARPTTAYPAVGDIPSRPDKPAMTTDEQSKLKKELSAARDRQVPKNSLKDNPKNIPKNNLKSNKVTKP